MQRHSSLSDLHSDYAGGRMDRKTLEGLIFQYLLDNFGKYHLFGKNQDQWADFVSWLYPRLSRAIDLYRETGSTFDSYINSIIQWSSKEYRAKEAIHKTTEYACWAAKGEELQVRNAEPEYAAELEEPREKTRPLFPQSYFSCRQILFIFLKSYYFVTPDFLATVADAIGMEKKELQALVDKLHEMRADREIKIRLSQEMVYSQYYRCQAFQQRLSLATPGTARYEKIRNYSERARKRFSAMRQRVSRIRVDASNRQISMVLHIPKGTVDSAFFNIKRKQKLMEERLAGKNGEGYHEACSATATVSTRATPLMS